jgi:nucleoside-diphosphate-sugar epimerase
MSLNILVTGGAGYLGSVMVPELLKLGHKVTVLDTFMFGQNSLADVCFMDNFNVVRGDTRDKKLLKELTKDKDVVIPLAALVGAPLCNRDQIGTLTINRDAVQTLSDVLSPSQKVLMPITNSGYGVGEDGVYCTEETPLRPISTYGKTKVEAEEIILQRENSISFRLATVFGMSPRMRLDLLVNDFTYRAVNDGFIVVFEGHFKRNYIHIRDVVNAFIHGINNFESMKGEAYNVGLSEANLSKIELCEKIKQHVPNFTIMEAEIGKDPDQRNYIVSNDKLEATGWKPEFGLDRGIKELIKGYTIINNSKFANV